MPPIISLKLYIFFTSIKCFSYNQRRSSKNRRANIAISSFKLWLR